VQTYPSGSLPSCPNANNVLPSNSHFASNPRDPQPATSLQISESLSRYFSSYSVDPQIQPPASTIVLQQCPHISRPYPIPCFASGDGISHDSALSFYKGGSHV
jgi:hypothetical protein